MNGYLARRLKAIQQAGASEALRSGLRGVEKECLRVSPEGSIAKTPHPTALGSALTHPSITTDYSEALLEFVTPPSDSSWATLQCLVDLHGFTVENLGDEFLWAASMPCMMGTDAEVPIARYGSSNVGTIKEVYRRGLGHRYGRIMQTISGVHFNYSVDQRIWSVLEELEGPGPSGQAFISDGYFRLLRNFRRLGWLVLYLFGNSPAVCRSFLGGETAGLDSLDRYTLYGPHATSLRMSDIGYKNKAQSRVSVSQDGLDAYVRDLRKAISTPHPPYEKIGVKVDGQYRQLNANLLQIENEFYSNIRPKRVALSGERPTDALERRGVEYVELRAVDVSVFDPAGLNQPQLRFLELFALLCLLSDGPSITDDEQRLIDANLLDVARGGRKPGLELSRPGADGAPEQVALADWAGEILNSMQVMAELADSGLEDSPYSDAIRRQVAPVRDPQCTPSAMVLGELVSNSESFYEFGMRMSRQHRDYFLSLAQVNEGRRAQLEMEARCSLARQHAIEESDNLSFDEYLARYLAGTLEPTDRGGPPVDST